MRHAATILACLFSVAALALVIWVAVLLVSDPRGVIRDALLKKAHD